MKVHRENRSYNGWIFFLIAPIFTFMIFWLISTLFPKSVDDIPLAQGLTEMPIVLSMREILSEAAISYLTIMIIHLVVFFLARLFHIQKLLYIVLCALIASLLGLTLARTPIGTQFTWSAIINFHLKRGGDTGIDSTIRWLLSLFSIGIGVFTSFGLIGLSVLYSKLKTKEYSGIH